MAIQRIAVKLYPAAVKVKLIPPLIKLRLYAGGGNSGPSKYVETVAYDTATGLLTMVQVNQGVRSTVTIDTAEVGVCPVPE